MPAASHPIPSLDRNHRNGENMLLPRGQGAEQTGKVKGECEFQYKDGGVHVLVICDDHTAPGKLDAEVLSIRTYAHDKK